jgi:hypothetical protein
VLLGSASFRLNKLLAGKSAPRGNFFQKTAVSLQQSENFPKEGGTPIIYEELQHP